MFIAICVLLNILSANGIAIPAVAFWWSGLGALVETIVKIGDFLDKHSSK